MKFWGLGKIDEFCPVSCSQGEPAVSVEIVLDAFLLSGQDEIAGFSRA